MSKLCFAGQVSYSSVQRVRIRFAQVLQMCQLSKLDGLFNTWFSTAELGALATSSSSSSPIITVLPWKWDESPDISYVTQTVRVDRAAPVAEAQAAQPAQDALPSLPPLRVDDEADSMDVDVAAVAVGAPAPVGLNMVAAGQWLR